MTDSEHTAWLWLMALPRVDVPKGATGPQMREIIDRQIKITACPGKLHVNSGAPLVRVSILLPNLRRVNGIGNSLYAACSRACSEAWRAGFEWTSPDIFHIERVRRGEAP